MKNTTMRSIVSIVLFIAILLVMGFGLRNGSAQDRSVSDGSANTVQTRIYDAEMMEGKCA